MCSRCQQPCLRTFSSIRWCPVWRCSLQRLFASTVGVKEADIPNLSSHMVAASPGALPMLEQALTGSTRPFTWTFAASSVTLVVDNHWAQLDDDTRYHVARFLLQWLGDRGAAAPTYARTPAITALCRITKLAWRSDPRHHSTPDHALRFLDSTTPYQYKLLGLELLERLVQDMERPHPLVPDRVVIRLLMFREMALRPLFGRLVGLLQETSTAATQLFASVQLVSAGRSPSPSTGLAGVPPSKLVPDLSDQLVLSRRALIVAQTVLSFDFSAIGAGLAAAGAGAFGNEDEDGGDGEAGLGAGEDTEPTNLPITWILFKHTASFAVFFEHVRLFMAIHQAAVGSPSFAQPTGNPHLASLSQAVYQGGLEALRTCAHLAGCSYAGWTDTHQRVRRCLFMRESVFMMAYCMTSPDAASLVSHGWWHEVSRFLLRAKITIHLANMLHPSHQWREYIIALAAFTYRCLDKSPSPAGKPLIPRRTCEHLLAVWALLYMPCVYLSVADPASVMLRSAMEPLRRAIFNRFMPAGCDVISGGSGGGNDASMPSLDDSGAADGDDDDDRDDDEAPASSGPGAAVSGTAVETAADDMIELCAEICRYDLHGAVRDATRMIDALTDRLRRATDAATVSTCQRGLAWLARFAAPLITSATSSSSNGNEDESFVLGSLPLPSGDPSLSLAPEHVLPQFSKLAAGLLQWSAAWAADPDACAGQVVRHAAGAGAAGVSNGGGLQSSPTMGISVSDANGGGSMTGGQQQHMDGGGGGRPGATGQAGARQLRLAEADGTARLQNLLQHQATTGAGVDASDDLGMGMGLGQGGNRVLSSSIAAAGVPTPRLAHQARNQDDDDDDDDDLIEDDIRGLMPWTLGSSPTAGPVSNTTPFGSSYYRPLQAGKLLDEEDDDSSDDHDDEAASSRSSGSDEDAFSAGLGARQDPPGAVLARVLATGWAPLSVVSAAMSSSSSSSMSSTLSFEPTHMARPVVLALLAMPWVDYSVGLPQGTGGSSNSSIVPHTPWGGIAASNGNNGTIFPATSPNGGVAGGAGFPAYVSPGMFGSTATPSSFASSSSARAPWTGASFTGLHHQTSSTPGPTSNSTMTDVNLGVDIGAMAPSTAASAQMRARLDMSSQLQQLTTELRAEKACAPLVCAIFKLVLLLRARASAAAATSGVGRPGGGGANNAMPYAAPSFDGGGSSSSSLSPSSAVPVVGSPVGGFGGLSTPLGDATMGMASIGVGSMMGAGASAASMAADLTGSGDSSGGLSDIDDVGAQLLKGLSLSDDAAVGAGSSSSTSGSGMTTPGGIALPFGLGYRRSNGGGTGLRMTRQDSGGSGLSPGWPSSSTGLRSFTSPAIDSGDRGMPGIGFGFNPASSSMGPGQSSKQVSGGYSSSFFASSASAPAAPQLTLAWTRPRCTLELSLLSFFSVFHTMYCSYRSDAEMILKNRVAVEAFDTQQQQQQQQPATGDGIANQQFQAPASFPASSAGAAGTMFTMHEGRLVPVQAAFGDTAVMGAHDFDASGGSTMEDIGLIAATIANTGTGGGGVPLVRNAAQAARLRVQTAAASDRNLLIQLMPLLGAKQPFELLDVVVAKVLDNMRLDASTPTNIMAASLRSLHELAVGVTLVLRRATGPLAGMLTEQRAVTVGDDLLRTVCVRALLRRPVSLLFPPLRLPQHARYRSALYATMTRLLFLNAQAVTAPARGILREKKKQEQQQQVHNTTPAALPSASTSSFAVSGSTADARLDGFKLQDAIMSAASRSSTATGGAGGGWLSQAALPSASSSATAVDDADAASASYSDEPSSNMYVFTTPSATGTSGGGGAASAWFTSFVAPLTHAIAAIRQGLGLAPQPPSAASGGGYTAVIGAEETAGAGGMLPGAARARECKPAVIGLLRDLRGVVAATTTANEFRLVHDWLTSCGAHALMFRCATLYRGGQHSDVIIPLLRVILEYASNRSNRIVFPPGNASGYIVYREAARCVTAIAAHSMATPVLPTGTVASQPGNAMGEGVRLKIWSLCLLVGWRLMSGRFANTGVMTFYGDATASELWHACVQIALATPLSALEQRDKLAAAVYMCGDAIVNTPLPPPLVPVRTASASSSSSSASAVPHVVAVSHFLPSPTDTCAPSPGTVAALIRLPTPLFIAFLLRLTSSLTPRSAAMTRYSANGLSALEAVLTVEAEARLLARAVAQAQPGGLTGVDLDRPVRLPTGMRMAPSAAIDLVQRMDAHCSAPTVLGSDARAGGDGARAAAIAAIMGGQQPPPRADASSSSSSGQQQPAYLNGCFGTDFTTHAMMAGIRASANTSNSSSALMDVWVLGRLVLLNMISRPAAFQVAIGGLAGSANSEEASEEVDEVTRDLGSAGQTIADPTTADGKDAFCRVFVRWAKLLSGKV